MLVRIGLKWDWFASDGIGLDVAGLVLFAFAWSGSD